MKNTIQLFIDSEKKVKGYPITSPDRVIDDTGVSIKKRLQNNVKFDIVGDGEEVPEIDGGYDDRELVEKIDNISEQMDNIAYSINSFQRIVPELNDSPRFQRAINTIPDNATLMLNDEIYNLRTPVKLTKSIKMLGVGKNNSTITSDNSIRTAFVSNDKDINIIFDNLLFVGGVIDTGELISRDTRQHNPSFQVAFEISNAKHLIIKNCGFERIEDIPIYVYNCDNVTMKYCYSDYCFDFGFVNNRRLLINGNRVNRSGDNGISISRLNSKAIITNNIIENSYYSGIFVSGFVDDYGVDKAIVSNNIIVNSNKHGIEAISGSIEMIISNNYIDGVSRITENTELTMRSGIGISLGAHPKRNSKDISINNNIIKACELGGIHCGSTVNYTINDNTIIDFGSKLNHLKEEVLEYDSKSQPQNFGIAIFSGSSNGNIFNNHFIENREDKDIAKFPIFINNLSHNIKLKGNTIIGLKSLFGNINPSAFDGTNINLDAPKYSIIKSPSLTKGNGYSNWSEGKVNMSNGALVITSNNSVEAGALCSIVTNQTYTKQLIFEIEFSIDTSIESSGILIDWKKSDGSNDRHLIKFSDYVKTFEPNKKYKIKDIITTTATITEFNGYQIILIANFTQLSPNRKAKVLTVYDFNVY